MKTTTEFTATLRTNLNTIRNHGGKVTLRAASPSGDQLVAMGYLTRTGLTYAITPAGEARLLDRSDMSAEDQTRIARQCLRDHASE